MASPMPSMQLTPMLGQYLVAINGFVGAQNEQALAGYMPIEPPFHDPTMQQIIAELQQTYPPGHEDALEGKCSDALTVARDGIEGSPSWSQFTRFVVQYLTYIRDVGLDEDQYYQTYEMLYELQKRANSALTHATLGNLMLPIVVGFAKVICKLAIFIDKHPERFAHLKPNRGGGEDDGPSSTLPERAAELLRGGLTTCLNDRFSSIEDGRVQGKKRGIYLIANVCLKIFFQCRKTRNASMIFTNIGNLSPPLSSYPRAQRVTYLYYLGRFWFQNSHLDRARLALQSAYDESPAVQQCWHQRRLILIFLIASNIILGRFPSEPIFERREAKGLAQHFRPLMQAIRTGNLALFRQHMDMDGPHADFFFYYRILLQLRDRCEVLVWRSLVRKTWILSGTRYTSGGQPPLVDIKNLVGIFGLLEGRAAKHAEVAWVDPDFAGVEFDGPTPDPNAITPLKMESILSSLVTQGFLQGFIAHRQAKFVFTRVKQAGGDVLAAGFPTPWKTIERKIAQSGFADEVPGWKQGAPGSMAAGGGGGGMVINMSGARPVGAT
ncbi:Hypothetical predicted protein [Lecanosticta acicola]|uniref:PCI domain-containing protein n=1 Tax=Lecanosticta acicola TaxID=111012 RepID=A0AAI9ECZ8_9PEZI|nr:Hypothetical predicted protein [Lecanosticta acicola]